MDIREEATAALANYLFMYPEEDSAMRALAAQLKEDANDVGNRANMLGHITTSGLVVDAARQVVLLIHHNVFDRLLQPGGHYESQVDGSSCLWGSAAREVMEETGLVDFKLHPWSGGVCVPIDIDTHDIPANLKKHELQHRHHDFLYLASGDSTIPLTPQLDEVSAAKWVPIAELSTMRARQQRVYRKLVDLQVVRP